MRVDRLCALSLAAGLAWLGAPRVAEAATLCTASATPLAFGSVSGSAPVDVDGTVTVNCQTFAVALLSTIRVRMCLNIGAGLSGDGQYAPRRMRNATTDPMQFQIYRDPARSLVWGNVGAGAAPTPLETTFEYFVLLLGGSNLLNIPMHGRIPAQTGLAAGVYANAFTGAETRLDYRYNEPILGVVDFPASCTTGGTGGGSVSFPFTASAPVSNRCTITSVTPMAFGTVAGRVSGNLDQAGTLVFNCTGRTAWTVGLDNGSHASGSVRRMRLGPAGTHYVHYELYRDPTRVQRWGATAPTGAATGTGTGFSQSLPIYGRVPGPQVVPAGTYTDTVQVTITY
ncbi:MAG: spore coat U domain-containing protein [Luteimonas sp.]